MTVRNSSSDAFVLFFSLFLSLSVCLSVCLSICLSACLPACLPISCIVYCNPLLLEIGKTLSNKLESVNSFALRTLLNQASNTEYNPILGLSSMRSIEHGRYEQLLLLFYKCIGFATGYSQRTNK